MTHWFDLEPVGVDFFDTAPHIFTYSIDLAAEPDAVWAGLTADEPLSWCRLLTKVHYTSPRPYGVGTRRIAEVGGGAMQMREKFITWDDETRRHSFYVEQSNVPLFQSFAEDYRVDELAVGS
ncbi:SRPBCC family protein, partial [Rhodococcus sp. (in: high G+C Gram-positive bacteria)]